MPSPPRSPLSAKSGRKSRESYMDQPTSVPQRDESHHRIETREGPLSSAHDNFHESLQREALGKLNDVYVVLQQTNSQVNSLTKRSKDNQGELGNLKAATHARDQEIRIVLGDIKDDLITDTSRERMLLALENLTTKMSSKADISMQVEIHMAIESIRNEIKLTARSSEKAVSAMACRLDDYFGQVHEPAFPDLSILDIIHGRLQDTFEVLTLLSESHKQQEISREKALLELEAIQKDKVLATAQLTAIETALSFRKQEFHELTERATEFENRLRTAALEKSRNLLLSHSNPSSLFTFTKPETIAKHTPSSIFKMPQVGARRHQSLSQMSSPNILSNSPLQPQKRPTRQFSISKNLKGLFSKEKENIDENDEFGLTPGQNPDSGPPKKSYGLLISGEASPSSPRWRSISERV